VPEGDTVWLVARNLDRALGRDRLVRSDLRVPQLATVDLTDRVVLEIVPRGKHLLARLEGALTLHSHLRLDGMWHLYRHGDTWAGGPAHDIRAVLSTEAWDAVGYRVHDLALVGTDREDELVGHLGPDLLDPGFDREQARRRLQAEPGREIGVALLDQRCLAGIGNMYKSETLFVRRISPWSRTGDLDDDTVGGLVDTARRLLDANKTHASQATTGDPRRGYEHWVYGRAGRPCRRCGTAIAQAQQGAPPYDRPTFWCPRCQSTPVLS
jgi:endonuclease-8